MVKPVQNQTRVTTNDLFFTAGTGASFATNGAFEYAVFDGTVYRLRELSLAYSLPAKWLSKAKITGITLSLTGRNLVSRYGTERIPAEREQGFVAGIRLT
jgi:hypothetical protein